MVWKVGGSSSFIVFHSRAAQDKFLLTERLELCELIFLHEFLNLFRERKSNLQKSFKNNVCACPKVAVVNMILFLPCLLHSLSVYAQQILGVSFSYYILFASPFASKLQTSFSVIFRSVFYSLPHCFQSEFLMLIIKKSKPFSLF